jgi:hypothetical protein
MDRILFALGVGVVVFVAAASAVGTGRSAGGSLSNNGWVLCDADGVSVTYQDPNNDGNYERATVGDIDCPGKYKVDVKILDLEPRQRTLASGQRTTSGPIAVIALTNVILDLEIEDADRVQVTITSNH